MSNISKVMNPLAESLPDFFKNSAQQVSHFFGRIVSTIKLIPVQMHQSRNVTMSVYAAANVTAFTAANLFANWIDKSFEQSANKLNDDQKPFKDAMLNIVVVGGSLLIANVIVSNMTHSPISKVALLALSMTGAGARYLLQSAPSFFQKGSTIEEDVKQPHSHPNNPAQKLEEEQNELQLLNLQKGSTIEEDVKLSHSHPNSPDPKLQEKNQLQLLDNEKNG
ncbi:MAG: hypothetical protein ACH350_10635 [Parachlamydiaceae bacterium]